MANWGAAMGVVMSLLCYRSRPTTKNHTSGRTTSKGGRSDIEWACQSSERSHARSQFSVLRVQWGCLNAEVSVSRCALMIGNAEMPNILNPLKNLLAFLIADG